VSGAGEVRADLRAALEAFAALPEVLVALDFDGVCAPIVPVPSEARPLPATTAALERLAGSAGTTLAMVSGRTLADLHAYAAAPAGTVLVASHGAEVEGVELDLDDDARELLATITAEVQTVVAAHAGTDVELKPAGVVLHTRRARPEVAEHAATAVREGAAARAGVLAIPGKQVLELSVVDTSKGASVAALREGLGAVRDGAGWSGGPAVLYAGDDTTDETVLSTLQQDRGDVGVRVGGGDTAARHHLAGPEDVAAMLTLLADLRP
jgi:trehalose-phosphatase